ncbi:FecR family protein [Pseudomonas sp. LRF_L74]|uniref:FecR family protein n=1 Tax=Pseudomonas sp. LRF_L74 TaxID=3369422 RepID=UPI003F61A10B
MNDDELFAQASAWHFRLQAEDVSEQDRRDFAIWLQQGEAHSLAWDEAQTLLAALMPAAREVYHTAPARRRQTWPWATAAALLLALGLAWQTPWPDRLRADYYTAVGASRTVELADGSRIELNTDAALRVELSGAERRVELLRGEAWFDVAHDVSRPFVVESDGLQVRVLGTQFDVVREADHTRVRLAQGRVEASVKGGSPVVLAPGQSVALERGQLSSLSDFDPAQAFAWRQRQLVFRQQALGEVIAELNRYWPGRLLVADQALESRPVSGVFEIDKPEAVLRALQLTLGLQVEHYTPYLTVLRGGK